MQHWCAQERGREATDGGGRGGGGGGRQAHAGGDLAQEEEEGTEAVGEVPKNGKHFGYNLWLISFFQYLSVGFNRSSLIAQILTDRN